MPILGAFIVPHPPLIVAEVGRGQQLKCQKTIEAYRQIAKSIATLSPDTILIITPHSTTYSNYFHISPGHVAEGSFQEFGARDVKIKTEYDEGLVNEIISIAQSNGLQVGTRGEKQKALDHGTMVPLYFIQKEYQAFKTVRLSLSGFSPLAHYHLGQSIQKAINKTNRRVVIVASGDLSHKLKEDGPYGLSKEGPLFDEQIIQAMKNADFMKFLNFDSQFCEKAAECGLNSFIIMAGALDGLSVEPTLSSYEGPFGVGYAIASYHITGEDLSRCFDKQFYIEEKERIDKLKVKEDPYVQLARRTIESYVLNHTRVARPKDLPKAMLTERAGVFVSLKLDGRLRGCIGTISPTMATIADEIIQNAISAGTRDPRFDPVEASELPRLVYSVDVLGTSAPIQSMDELDVLKYGVIVRLDSRSGLLLPNLEGVDTPEEQVEIALQKAGIHFNEPYTMERFEVVRHY